MAPGDAGLNALQSELGGLYENLDNWEVRVETLQAAMSQEDRKARLATINAEHQAEKQELEGVEKVD